MKTPFWFLKQNPIAWLLIPFSVVYYFFGRIVFWFRKFRQVKSRRLIICVGNILAVQDEVFNYHKNTETNIIFCRFPLTNGE